MMLTRALGRLQAQPLTIEGHPHMGRRAEAKTGRGAARHSRDARCRGKGSERMDSMGGAQRPASQRALEDSARSRGLRVVTPGVVKSPA